MRPGPAARRAIRCSRCSGQIEKDGKTSYLLGTMHLGVDPTTRLPDIVWQKLDASPTFAMETDLSEPAKLDVMRARRRRRCKELGDEYWKKLEDALGAGEARAARSASSR